MSVQSGSAEATQYTYVIFAHNRPEAVLRLARAILHETSGSRVVIHYSAASGAFPSADDPRIACVEDPAHVKYATYSIADMMLRTLRQVRRDRAPNEWIIFLSGQCYPARPLDEFQRLLVATRDDALLWYREIEPTDFAMRDRYAFRYREIRQRGLPFPLSLRPVRGIVNRAQPLLRLKSMPRMSLLGVRARRSIFTAVPKVYVGTQWSVLSARAADRIIDRIANEPDWDQLYRHAFFAEESQIPTLLMNSPDLRVRNADVHYTDWSQARGSSPKSLGLADLAAIETSGKWFARKIDLDAGDALRDALDRLRAARRALNGAEVDR